MNEWNGKPYYSLDSYLKEQYGKKIYKIALESNVTCPNRDGTIGFDGCTFCSSGGSGEFASKRNVTIKEQLEQGKQLFRDKHIGDQFIAYFQSYTNTYAPIPYLNEIFTEALMEDSIVGISIATRPDCLGNDVLSLLSRLKEQFPTKFIWVEIGLQTMHEKTACLINRGYPLSCFEQALSNLNQLEIPVIVHIILGLPHETKEDMLETIHYLNHLSIWGIKLQLLHVLNGTKMAIDYKEGKFEVLTMTQYLDIVISCLESLSQNIVIHRVTGDGPKNLLLAPLWSLQKRTVLNTLHKVMKEKNTWQGKQYHAR